MRREVAGNYRVLLALAAWCALAVAARAKDAVYEVEVRADVKVPMSDGTNLAAHVFLPKSEGKFPAILMRTPYGKGGAQGGPGFAYASRGYAFVSQDCRGRGESEGAWEPFVNEASDGKDTHRWILDQPWSNGSIGTAGGSYVGYTQWISSADAGPHLKAMFPVVPLMEPYSDGAYVHGAFLLSLMMGWGAGVSGSESVRTWDQAAWDKAFR
ncbi:MAG: CocE/NonD family hydrolase, partial [Thermoguttaceae bacterium]